MLPGRLTRWKGGLDFIEAIARLGRRDICCVLVGAEQRAGFRRELETQIERHGLLGQFRIVEDCRDMPAAYVLADVVVSASTDPEGLRPHHRRGAGDGPPGDRHRPRRRARNRHSRQYRLAGAAGRHSGDGGRDRRGLEPRPRSRDGAGAARRARISPPASPARRCARARSISTRSCCSPRRGRCPSGAASRWRSRPSVGGGLPARSGRDSRCLSSTRIEMERILVIKLGALGDFVQAMGAAAAIRAFHRERRDHPADHPPLCRVGAPGAVFRSRSGSTSGRAGATRPASWRLRAAVARRPVRPRLRPLDAAAQRAFISG